MSKKEKVKSCEEIEIEVEDFSKTEKILTNLGLKVKGKTLTKHRESYSIENTHFEIETPLEEYSFIPIFMEIESTDEETIYKYAKILGFSEKDCLSWTGKDVIDYYRKRTK